jgi:hypothetical protein
LHPRAVQIAGERHIAGGDIRVAAQAFIPRGLSEAGNQILANIVGLHL